MEDKKKKKEEKKKREASQKVPEQKIKVPESAKPSGPQPLATPDSVSPSPGPVSPSSPSPGAGGSSAQVLPGGGNNAKQWSAVANGQPSSSPSGSQTSQQQRYMSREVPPRFRCQQDHKVLLKRGQPPLSSMLLGGGGGGEAEAGTGGAREGSGWVAALSSQGADNPVANTDGHAESSLGSSSPSSPNSSSLCVAAQSSSTTSSTYANSTWGAGSSSQSSSQGCGKVIVDGTDLDDWPSIPAGPKLSSDGAGGGMQEQNCPSNNSSASWGEKNMQQKGGTGEGNKDNPSPLQSASLSSSSFSECAQSSGNVWVSSTSSQVETGTGSAAFHNSKVSSLLPGPQESPVGGSGNVSGANFNPSANPSAWPALGQSGASASANDSFSLHSSITSSFSASTTLITTQTLSSVNQTGLYQQHTETAVGTKVGEQHLGNPGLEPGSGGGVREAGPSSNSEGNSGVVGEVKGNGKLTGSLSSSSAPSSWRPMPPVSSELSEGASQAGGGGTGPQGQEGNVWRFGSQDDKAGWGRGNGGGSAATVVTQGVWAGSSSEADWGGTSEGVSSSNLAIGSGRGGDGSSTTTDGVGGSGLEDSVSPNFATMTKAWDNQKGMESGEGVVGEWGGGSQDGTTEGGGGPSSSSGGGSLAGSGSGKSGNKDSSSAHHQSHPSANADVALLSMLSRSDLDPRVLSNTGWGQTQIRQNVAWDLDTTAGVGNRNERNMSSAPINTSTNRSSRYPSETGSVSNDVSSGGRTTSLNSDSATVRDGWEGGGSQPSCGPFTPSSTIRKPGTPEDDTQGKAAGGWGDLPPERESKGWRSEDQKWGDHRGGGGKNWRDVEEKGSGWSDGPEDKGTVGWKGPTGGETGGWGGQTGGGEQWGQRDSTSGGGWGDGKNRVGSNSDEGTSWGNLDEGGSQRGRWEGDVGGGKSHQDWGSAKPNTAAAPIPNSQVAPMKAQNQQQQQSQGQHPPGGPIQGGWNSRPSIGGGGPLSKNQNQSMGWTSGPIPQISGGGADALEPSGWEEPSPQSICRKMEIDDGTSAWGDPTCYGNKNVNLRDKNSATPSQNHGQQGPPLPMQQQPPRRQHSTNPNPGTGAMGMWGGGAQTVDNGTAAWGHTSDAATGWGEPDEPSKASGWRNPSPNSVKPGGKPVESWGGKDDSSIAASRHPSWEEDDDGGGGVWNSTSSQGSSSSFNSGGWGQTHGGKRSNIKSGQGESWVNPVTRQFSNMGLMGDDPGVDKKMEGDKRGLTDYNGEMRRGGRGGGGYRMPSSKDMGPVDMGLYGEKVGGHGAFAAGGGGMSQSRGMHQQLGMHPMNPSQGLRAQVPHQFLSPQVPGPMLKQVPSPGGNVGGVGGVGSVGGVAGGMFPPQISPQQLAMLSNINPHMQQFHLACQLLLQQQQQQQQQQQLLQNQRKFPQPQPLRQQTDPQQLARIMAILQQQRQHQQAGGGGATSGGGSSKLSPSHLGGGSLSKQTMVDPLQHTGVGGPLSDLHSKTQGMYAGLTPGGNMSSLELSPMMGGMKNMGGQQSRFKWMMEGHSPAPSPPDTTLHKNGPLPSAIKVQGGSPYSQYEMLGSEGLGIPPQGSADNWLRTPGSKMGNKPSTSSWPPEFQPGVPWKGIQSSGDPESDPYMTPGSVLGSPGSPNLNDPDHPLLRDNIGQNPSLNTSLPSSGAWPYSASDSSLSNAHSTGKYSEYKPSWPPEPIGQNKWKTNRNSSQLPRPPPGLTSQKQASPSPWGSAGPRLARSWGGGGMNQESRFGSGSAWSDGVTSRGSCWLLLSNLTPQIDGSTLRTICMQHGPLLTFHLGLTQGSALIRYNSRQEAAKAQSALHMCVLGNTTILAEFVSEEVARYFAHSQAGGAEGVGSGGAAAGSGGAPGSSGAGTAVGSGDRSSPGSERAAVGASSGGNGNGGGGDSGAGVLAGVRSSGSAWQSLDGTGTSSETSSAQGPGLAIFSQWSTNGAGEGGGVGGVEPGRSGLWGGMSTGYSSSSLWGAPQMEERHQIDNSSGLLPGNLLGGGADSI